LHTKFFRYDRGEGEADMAIDPNKIDPGLNYPLKQVAQFLEISYGTMLKLKKEARLKSTRVGKRYYIKGKDVLEYIEHGG
jgi:excisionase family DNA binding protein